MTVTDHYAEIVDSVVDRIIVAPSQAWCTDSLGGTWVEVNSPYTSAASAWHVSATRAE